MVTESRVVNTAHPITSRTGANRATKARETLATAQAILRASTAGPNLAADAMQTNIDQLSARIYDYYRNAR